ncbi:MAG: monothiol glutaredoxin [Lentimonas sp.]|jgi:monothiol glutaredoxin
MSNIKNEIESTIKNNKVVLFMKGSKDFPQCGFSAAVSHILSTIGVDFVDIDVLKDAELRQEIKNFSDWPTIPQLYVNGEFVGGCDIIKEMHQDGELQSLLTK